MPIALSTICTTVEVAPLSQSITMPGGIRLGASWSGAVPPTLSGITKELFSHFNTALAPLQPIFNIIDAITAIFDVLKAVATLNPVEIKEALPAVASSVAKLAGLIPALSVPVMIADAVKVLRDFLSGLISNLRGQINFALTIAQSEIVAGLEGNDALIEIVACARQDQQSTVNFINEGMAPIARLVGLINSFLDLIGVDKKIPDLGTIDFSGLENIVKKFDAVVLFLDTLLAAIPIASNPPDPATGGFA